jgi:hypothetical protein
MCTGDVDKNFKSNTSMSIYSQNDFQPSHNKMKNSNWKELINFLDRIDFVEPSNEELNNCSPITLDSNDIDETLKNDQIFDFKNKNSDYETFEKIINNKKNKDDKVVVNEHNPQYSMKKHNAKRLKQLCMLENDPNIKISRFYDLRLKYLKNPLSTFKNKIENYIFENIPDSYVLTHVKRLRDIDKICVIFDNNNLDCDKYFSIFNILYDAIFCDRLKQINSRFNKDLKFSLKTCDVFLAQFNALIYHSFEANELREKLEILPYFQKYLFFYYELMKLYKYIYEIPELLTIGGLFSERSFSNVIFLMHQINLFCEIFENIKDHRIFILCMIYKTYSCQNEKNGLDIFSIPNYEFKCATTSHDLYYFLWEFNSYKRRDIKC